MCTESIHVHVDTGADIDVYINVGIGRNKCQDRFEVDSKDRIREAYDTTGLLGILGHVLMAVIEAPTVWSHDLQGLTCPRTTGYVRKVTHGNGCTSFHVTLHIPKKNKDHETSVSLSTPGASLLLSFSA